MSSQELNFKSDEALEARLIQLHLLDEFRFRAYESLAFYKERKKK